MEALVVIGILILFGWSLKTAIQATFKKGKYKELEKGYEDLANKHNSLVDEITKYEKQINKICNKYISDLKREVLKDITINNYSSSHNKLEKVIDFCVKQGFEPEYHLRKTIERELKDKFETAVRKDIAKQEQARIKEQIRDEQRAEKEFERELKRIETEEYAIEKAIEAALAKTNDEHSDEVERLKAQLAEAHSRFERTKSRAELTRAGHVYVISNIGSFGENVFKVGMTRRLEPLDRVKELGDASVPFPFDIHMMVSCDDAPKLESTLHNELHKARMNKVNLRKEFFQADLDQIHKLVVANHGSVDYVATPDALEYNESQNMTDEDYEFTTGKPAGDRLPGQPEQEPVHEVTEEFVFEEAADTEPLQEEKPAIIALAPDPARPEITKAQCGSCDKILTYPKKMEGKNVDCPDCQQAFVLP